MQSNLEGLYFFSSCSRLTHPEKAHFRRDKIILNKNCFLKGKNEKDEIFYSNKSRSHYWCVT